MNSLTGRQLVAGPAGVIECALDLPQRAPRGLAVVCHPNPLQGGTMDNKVVHTLARAFVQLGYRALRFNYRGVGASAGAWAEGPGEVADALAVVGALRQPGEALVLAGFSFGGYVAAAAAQCTEPAAERLVLVAPAVGRLGAVNVDAQSLVIHGETDDVVALTAVFDWARPQGLPITVIPGAGHFFHGRLALLKSLVLGAWHD